MYAQSLVTDHVVIRGRYSSATISLVGHLACAKQLKLDPEDDGAPPPPPLLPPSPLQSAGAAHAVQPPAVQPPPGPLPMAAVPKAFVSGLGEALKYYQQVGASQAKIDDKRPMKRLRPLKDTAEAVAAATTGASSPESNFF